MTVYRCGHPVTPENTVGRKRAKCAICDRDYGKRRRDELRPAQQEKNLSRYNANLPAYEGRNPSMTSMPAACDRLLSAIKAEHPYVIAAAYRDGRLPL